jgi:hypothetical protein
LASGAFIEEFNDEENTLWDEAFINEKKSWELLDLLVTTSPLSNIFSADYSKDNFLITFFENCQNPIPLAALGFYPSVVESSRETLQRLSLNTSSLAKMEKQLLAAFVLCKNLEKLADDTNSFADNTNFIEPDSQWLKNTYEKKREQKSQLLQETIQFTNQKFNELRHVLTLEFFLACHELCPQKRSLKNFILNKLITETGTPNKISEMIAVIWSQAAQWSVDWHVAPDSANDANRFLTHLAKNLFHKNFPSPDANDESLYSHCITLIVDELGNATHPLNSFCMNPVAWLRKFENRSNLRAVHVDELASSLQIELGLHIATCQSISAAWSETINLARQSRQWRNPAELDKLLAVALASQMEQCISDEFAQLIVPEQNRENLLHWVDSIKNQATRVDSNASSLKRPPSDDPEGAPPAKAARL